MTAILWRECAALSLLVLPAGCYVVPVAPEQMAWFYGQVPPPAASAALPGPPAVQTLPARLYPENEKAAQAGMLSGSIVSPATGKGRFTLNYKGEPLTGEATRVEGDPRGGVAAAYGPSGTWLNCEYQMRSMRSGVGSCSVSDGARFQVHVGE
jgi:hypothetical protein